MAQKKAETKKKKNDKPLKPKNLWEIRKEYFEYKMNLAVGKEKDTSKLKKMRKEIARMTMNLKSNQSNENGE